ncbi:MAG: sensor histidine kinase [Oscillospiraceae bacterium]
MRKKPMKTGTMALILAGIYLLGLILGVWLISYLPSGGKRVGLVYMVNGLAEQYTGSGQIDASPMSGVAAMVYSADGQLLAFDQRTHRVDHDFVRQGRKYLPGVLEGKETIRLVLLARDNSTLGYTSLVYVGVPLIEEGKITGALIWVRELRDLLESILGYICAYSIVFAAAAVFMLLNLRRQRQYEQMRRNYIDNITHELKTPVASIKALAEALSDGMEKSPGDRNVYYGMILREANRQERMICDVLELSKLQSCGVEITRRSAAAAEVFDPVCDKYATLCDLMGVAFTVSEEAKNLPDLVTDPKYLQVVLDALLSNALKFVPEGGTIRITAQVSRRQAVICVADNGKGIAKDELPHIFERFYKGNRSDNEAGSGLGLAIAREIMDAMKEKLWIRSKEGVGTAAYFTVTLKRPFSSPAAH